MPYRPQPPPVLKEECDSGVSTGSPYHEKPVTPVTAVTRLLEMPLSQFERDGRPLQVKVPWLADTLWFVPGPLEVDALAQKGISRGRVWTAAELTDLLKIPGLDTDGAATIARAKAEFGGEVISVTPDDSGSTSKPAAAHRGEGRSG